MNISLTNKIKKIYELLSVRNRSIFLSYILAFSPLIAILVSHTTIVELIWRASPFLIFLPFVIVASWYGGFLPGLVATIVATIVGDYFFLNPLYAFTIAETNDAIRLLLFTTVGLLIGMINQTFYNQKAERERLLKELIRSEERNKRIEKQKTTFLSSVAHELRTPLATTQLINELLLNKFQKSHTKEDVRDLQNMYAELASLSTIIQELLQFVRSEHVELPIHISKLSLTELIQQVVAIYYQSHPNFSISFSEQKKYMVSADGKRIKQVLHNLLDNAIKASHANGSIDISIGTQNNSVIVAIKDGGIGIPFSVQKRIFKRYYQMGENTHGGFGLGLYISQQIIQKHKGKIWVESHPNEGSTFSFSLPLK